MRANEPKPTKRAGQDETAFLGELQTFTDPPGGAPLDDPAVLARKRRGRPTNRRKPAPPKKNKTPPVE
jgi:hypothetical protein